jgi:rRNA processing protein Krr1/Pno1
MSATEVYVSVAVVGLSVGFLVMFPVISDCDLCSQCLMQAVSFGKMDTQAAGAIALCVMGLMFFFRNNNTPTEKPTSKSAFEKPTAAPEKAAPAKPTAEPVKAKKEIKQSKPKVAEPEEPVVATVVKDKKKKKKGAKEETTEVKSEVAKPAVKAAAAAGPVSKAKDVPAPTVAKLPVTAPADQKAADAKRVADQKAAADAKRVADQKAAPAAKAATPVVPAKTAPVPVPAKTAPVPVPGKTAPAPVPAAKATTAAATPEPEESKKAKKKKNKEEKEEIKAPVVVPAPVEEVEEGWINVKTRGAPKQDEVARFGDNLGKIKREEISVPVEHHAVVKGKNGSNLAELEKMTDTIIVVPPASSGSRWIMIKGLPSNVANAKAGIDELITKGYSKYTHPNRTDSIVIVPENKRSSVIGPAGSFIKKLTEKTGCEIEMPDKKSTDDQVKLLGDAAAVRMAKKYIEELVNDGFCEATHPNWKKDVVDDFPVDKIGRLLGAKGGNLKKIQEETGTKIITPARDADSNEPVTITICGPYEGVIQARLIVLLAKQDDPKDIIEDELDPDWAHLPPTKFYEWN